MKKIIICLITLIIAISFISCGNSDENNTIINDLENSDYLNVFNMTANTSYGEMMLNWVATDGYTTLVKITASDDLLEYCNLNNVTIDTPILSDYDKSFIDEHQSGMISACDCFAAKQIFEGTINSNSHEFSFAHQLVNNNGGTKHPVIRPCLNDTKNENESILIFYNTEPNAFEKFDLTILVNDIKEDFVFENLNCTVLPILCKNYEDSQLVYEFGGGKIKLSSIKSSLIDTYIDIEWEIYGATNTNPFFEKNIIVFDIDNDESISLPMFLMPPHNSDAALSIVTDSYTIGRYIPLDKRISVYAQRIEDDNVKIKMFEVN